MHVKAIRTGTDPLMRSRPDHSAPTLASIAKNCRFRQFLSCGGSVRWTVGSPADIRARTLGLVFLELRCRPQRRGGAPIRGPTRLSRRLGRRQRRCGLRVIAGHWQTSPGRQMPERFRTSPPVLPERQPLRAPRKGRCSDAHSFLRSLPSVRRQSRRTSDAAACHPSRFQQSESGGLGVALRFALWGN